MPEVSILRASGIGNTEPPIVSIVIDRQIRDDFSLAEIAVVFDAQAHLIADALCASLPGGTMDRLLAELLRRKASHFIITSWAPEKDSP